MTNILDITQLPPLHKIGQRLIGLDLGSKTIGIALSDGRLRIASAFQTLRRTKFKQDAEFLLALAEREQAVGFVIGLPLNMDGSEGPRVQATRAFIRNMGNLGELPFILWDERLSTVAAERVMIEADMSRKKRAEKIDAAAATFILQGALDRLSVLSSEAPSS
ncbi:MAG: Holliday junction resolvase RuvX [Rhizobiaceae bacterium]|nr:Holliday junction resolvase RuvX [Rhizobiaceae bacterium]MBL4695335.1 Holliday junction resolvase RuvX [Rhizobiaceae bacterium]